MWARSAGAEAARWNWLDGERGGGIGEDEGADLDGLAGGSVGWCVGDVEC